MSYVPYIDAAACAAHGDCVELAPTVFALNETAHVIGEGSPELIMEAAETCPSVAIAVFDQETGEQVYP